MKGTEVFQCPHPQCLFLHAAHFCALYSPQAKSSFPSPHEDAGGMHRDPFAAVNLSLNKSLLSIPAWPILQGRQSHPCWQYLAAVAASMLKPFCNRFSCVHKKTMTYASVTVTGDFSLSDKSPRVFTFPPVCLGPVYEGTRHHPPSSAPSTTGRGRDNKGQDSTGTS